MFKMIYINNKYAYKLNVLEGFDCWMHV